MVKKQGRKAQGKAAATKAKAASLHIGLNSVSAAGYDGWTGPLAACEFDANDMAALAKAKGMNPTVLLTKKGTRANVLAGIRGPSRLPGIPLACRSRPAPLDQLV